MPEQETPASALRSIIEWSQDKPDWQRDALRRLCQNRTLTPDDHTELLRICKDAHGIGDQEHPAPTAVPVGETHIPTDDTGVERVALRCIRDVRHVNALTTNQKVKFQKAGLTIIYGQNGSGKSGYARILAKSCRSRASDNILPNVYDAPSTNPPSATIEYVVGDSNQSLEWVDGGETADSLSAVSFFDSACANINVADTNSLAYTPTPLTILGELARACLSLRDQLQAGRTSLDALVPESLRDPPYRAQTPVGQLMAGISANTQYEVVEQLATLTEEERRRYDTLSRDLADDPNRRAAQLETVQRRLSALIRFLEQLDGLFSDDGIRQFRDVFQEAEAAQEAARLAADALFQSAPLPNVGSRTWRALWDAARGYSAESYPDQPFPVVGDSSRCLLCQQTLDQDARNRLTTFERFVQDNTQQLAIDTENAVEGHRQRFREVVSNCENTKDRVELIEHEVENAEIALQLRRYLILCRWRRRILLRARRSADIHEFSALPPELLNILRRQSEDLTRRIDALRVASQSNERRAQLSELHELEDRRWLGTVLGDVRSEIARKQKIASFDSCIRDVETSAITRMSSSVSDSLVTATLRNRFADELNRLDITHLLVELSRQRGEFGSSRFQISFIRTANAPLYRVLSEGEHRCVALAAFLAELATSPSASGIVFDDPVSSLDHQFREAFARRLAAEATHRQVIVFTHDLVFAFELAKFAKLRTVSTAYRHICRNDSAVGICDSDPPIEYRPIDDAVRHLRRRLNESRALYDAGRIGAWHDHARGLLGRIRETWERVVEVTIEPVLVRFSHEVKTRNLRVLTVLENEDCISVDEARANCSRLQHSTSAASPGTPLAPDTVGEEIDKLERWLNEIQRRQTELERGAH